MQKQREEHRESQWGDADSLTAVQNFLTQVLGLYTTFIAVIEKDHIFVHMGWVTWTWILVGVSFPIASLVVYQTHSWLTLLLSFGGTVGNALLGVVLLHIITITRDQLKYQESIPFSTMGSHR